MLETAFPWFLNEVYSVYDPVYQCVVGQQLRAATASACNKLLRIGQILIYEMRLGLQRAQGQCHARDVRRPRTISP